MRLAKRAKDREMRNACCPAFREDEPVAWIDAAVEVAERGVVRSTETMREPKQGAHVLARVNVDASTMDGIAPFRCACGQTFDSETAFWLGGIQ